ncbi:MAG TPA: cupin domain-containing protein [Gaiellaceae bacterium]|nr:cupin domain-containing protein [Gaiellaceae bacterium]
MERPPRDVSDPVSGQRWVFVRTGADTAGEVLEAELHVSPGGFVREHVHPGQEETFTGVEGTFVLEIAGRTRTLGPGESVVVPPGTPHGFADAPGPAVLKVVVRPALRLDDYFRAYLGLSRDGRIRLPAAGAPHGLLELALLLDRYAPEIAAPRIPRALQRALWRALAGVARMRGRSASYPEYGAP